jgi:hypothetical protein
MPCAGKLHARLDATAQISLFAKLKLAKCTRAGDRAGFFVARDSSVEGGGGTGAFTPRLRRGMAPCRRGNRSARGPAPVAALPNVRRRPRFAHPYPSPTTTAEPKTPTGGPSSVGPHLQVIRCQLIPTIPWRLTILRRRVLPRRRLQTTIGPRLSIGHRSCLRRGPSRHPTADRLMRSPPIGHASRRRPR